MAQRRSYLQKSLVKFMTKNQLQHGFDAIAVAEYNTKKRDEHRHKIKILLKCYLGGRLRRAMTIWKQNNFFITKSRYLLRKE